MFIVPKKKKIEFNGRRYLMAFCYEGANLRVLFEKSMNTIYLNELLSLDDIGHIAHLHCTTTTETKSTYIRYYNASRDSKDTLRLLIDSDGPYSKIFQWLVWGAVS